MIARARATLPVLLAAWLGATPAVAQQPTPPPTCDLEFAARDTTPPRLSSVRQPSGEYNTFIGGGVIARCPAQSMTITADSAENYGDRKVLHLIGTVHYTEPRVTLDAQRLTYFEAEEHLRAEGNVRAVLPSGSTMTGPTADYYRAVPGVRPQSSMTAPGRPTLVLIQLDSAGRKPDSVNVVANTIVTQGDSLVYASGRVVITRTDLVARSDSAAMDSGREFVRLVRNPVIEGKGERAYTLSGQLIDLTGRNRVLERVLASGSGKAVSEDATLTADTLDFRMADRMIQRSFAWGKSRARVRSPTYDIVADSLDVIMPRQRVLEVRAVRGAFAQSLPDTVKIRTRDRDWLRGDTIVAHFDTTARAVTRGDTARAQPRIRELIARGSAQSYYHIASKDPKATDPAINYVRGRAIAVTFTDGAVQQVTIQDQASGVYLDPTAPAADTGRARQRPAAATTGQRRP